MTSKLVSPPRDEPGRLNNKSMNALLWHFRLTIEFFGRTSWIMLLKNRQSDTRVGVISCKIVVLMNFTLEIIHAQCLSLSAAFALAHYCSRNVHASRSRCREQLGELETWLVCFSHAYNNLLACKINLICCWVILTAKLYSVILHKWKWDILQLFYIRAKCWWNVCWSPRAEKAISCTAPITTWSQHATLQLHWSWKKNNQFLIIVSKWARDP